MAHDQSSQPNGLETPKGIREGVLGEHIDTFATALSLQGYSWWTLRWKRLALGHLGQWLKGKSLRVVDLDERVLGDFLADATSSRALLPGRVLTLHQFLLHLRGEGMVRCPDRCEEPVSESSLLDRYDKFIREERGLARTTARQYRFFVQLFLSRPGAAAWHPQDLQARDLASFILDQATGKSSARAKVLVTALRSFLRFLLLSGEIEAPMAGAVPTVAAWSLSSIPKYLPAEQIRRMLAGCDRSTSTGRRDYAILLLLARLGFRAGEVVSLQLEDINWRAGEITVSGKGQVRDRLPLLTDVGEALAAYIQLDRPPCLVRRVFLCVKAPLRGLAGPSTIDGVVRSALSRAGLDPPRKGAHSLRHGLATSLIRAGASMDEISQVLRHRSSRTTEIYAKVDTLGLRTLALPWPEAGGGR